MKHFIIFAQMKKTLLFVGFTFLVHLSTIGQAPLKHIETREQLWLAVFNQSRFHKHWGTWLDVHYRITGNFVNRRMQFIFRPALTYFVTDDFRASLGYALVSHYPAEGFETVRTEHRPWQQVWWNQKYSGFSTVQWIRLEQRFNERVVADVKEDGYNYNFRVRYNLGFTIPMKGVVVSGKTPFVAISNEFFVNFGDRVVYNTFDQNRFFAGFGYAFTPHLNAQLGYMNVYQQEASGNNYVSSHTLRLFIYHSLDLRDAE